MNYNEDVQECKQCGFCHRENRSGSGVNYSDTFQCRFYPPRTGRGGRWPYVDGEDWCGHFTQRPTADKVYGLVRGLAWSERVK